MTNNPDLDAIRAEQQAQAWNEYDLFDRLFADNDALPIYTPATATTRSQLQ